MAHLWIKDDSEHWAILELREAALALTPQGPKPVHPLLEARDLPPDILLIPAGDAECNWVLMASAAGDASINGLPPVAGIRVLTDKDEISLSSFDSYYYSTESLARVESFPASGQTLFCPRCKQEIADGASAVKCPACKVWHHETDELNCWTYSDGCALCAHPTEMNGSFQWTPEEL